MRSEGEYISWPPRFCMIEFPAQACYRISALRQNRWIDGLNLPHGGDEKQNNQPNTASVEHSATDFQLVSSCLCSTLFENPTMSPTTRSLEDWRLAAVAVAFACTDPSSAADHNPIRQPVEDVNSAAVRRKEGLQPNENLLFNGWGVAPAGDQVPVSDMALKLVVAPDKRRLVAVSGGLSNQ